MREVVITSTVVEPHGITTIHNVCVNDNPVNDAVELCRCISEIEIDTLR